MQKALLALASVVALSTAGCHMTTSTNENWFGSTFGKYQPDNNQLAPTGETDDKGNKTFIAPSPDKSVQQDALSEIKYKQKINNFFVVTDASSSASEVYEDQNYEFKLANSNPTPPSKLELEKEILRRINETVSIIPDLKFITSIRSFGYGNCSIGSYNQTYLHLAPSEYSKTNFVEVLLDRKELSNADYERLKSVRLDCAHGRSLISNAIGYEACDHANNPGASNLIDCHGALHLTDSATKPVVDALNKAMGVKQDPVKRTVGSIRADLENTTGNIAVLIVSDGDLENSGFPSAPDPRVAIQQLVQKYPNRVCVYTVWTGNPSDEAAGGKKMLEDLSAITYPQCKSGYTEGFKPSVTAKEIAKPAAMENFVYNIFFNSELACLSRDSDSDGVNDCIDRCPDTPKGAHVNEFGCWVINNIKFDNDKSDIKPQYYAELNNAADVINNNPGIKVEIQGHTSNTWTAAYNMKLSWRRANAVKAYLSKKVRNPKVLTARGFGLTRPIDTNATEAGRANNRRVQLEVIK